MLVTKPAPNFKTMAVMPDNTIDTVALKIIKVKKVFILLSFGLYFCLTNRTY